MWRAGGRLDVSRTKEPAEVPSGGNLVQNPLNTCEETNTHTLLSCKILVFIEALTYYIDSKLLCCVQGCAGPKPILHNKLNMIGKPSLKGTWTMKSTYEHL